ncbi:hypothetical protein CH272_23655 [Rhodococcus sp. 05-340-1]|uniref:hypothetical protein n=1 Tax=unclassified Rhodococcus (in: high G+C Gram-positive bacteria) TaxID=192944 RepID=UPI000B9B08FD|nr:MULTISPECIES: hypothetical protein [unclassified Rhodococcus (in: high G+C Gram-positive bacteria)]OZD67440.1 hypothetical protein CH271_14325 [Rhodococcus sp. 05-340-2]OZD71889.1 hypothetical protein CH272_23655 [Rhodococcus sp. 05-340-1]
MEPMRPVDYVEQSTSGSEKRKQRWWRVFFGCLVIYQLIAFVVYDVGFWWVALTSIALCGLYELLWAVLNRSNSRRR